jgi:hypothetical protein
VNNRIKKLIIGFIPINHMLCTLRIAGRFFNYSIINAHAPVEDADDGKKDMRHSPRLIKNVHDMILKFW